MNNRKIPIFPGLGMLLACEPQPPPGQWLSLHDAYERLAKGDDKPGMGANEMMRRK